MRRSFRDNRWWGAIADNQDNGQAVGNRRAAYAAATPVIPHCREFLLRRRDWHSAARAGDRPRYRRDARRHHDRKQMNQSVTPDPAPRQGRPGAVRVWDLPTRVFHWVLAATVVGSVVSGKVGGNAMVWHVRFGYIVLTLLAFRFVWGLVGGYWSRFASFLPTPARVARYLRGAHRPDDHFDVGHSPLAALSVLAMLAVLSLQVATGLVADDEIATTGPLFRFVSSETSRMATGWHKSFGQWLIIGLVALHVAAVVFYRVGRGRDLVGPMLHGDKPLAHAGVPMSRDHAGTRVVAAVIVVACASAVAWIASLASL
jgi:cytochrome b